MAEYVDMIFTSEIFVLFALVFFTVFWILERFDRNYAIIFCSLSSFLFVAFNCPLFALIPLYQPPLIVLYCASRKPSYLTYHTFSIFFYAFLVFFDFTLKPYRVVNGFPRATRSGLVLTPLFMSLCFYFAGKRLPFIYFNF